MNRFVLAALAASLEATASTVGLQPAQALYEAAKAKIVTFEATVTDTMNPAHYGLDRNWSPATTAETAP